MQPNRISELSGQRVAVVVYSSYPADPRPRRAVEALLAEGMSIDVICLADEGQPAYETRGELSIRRLPLTHRRGGKLSYLVKYTAFIVLSALLMAARATRRRYSLAHVHNMPDVLVVSALVPKLLGAKVILDLHDPMPELMSTIYGLDPGSIPVRIIRWLEKWSIARADQVITVNEACHRIFGARSCNPSRIAVVMNTPDEKIFPLRPVERKEIDTRDTFVMMFHGSIVERNGLDLAVKALARVADRVPAVLKVYGNRTPYLDQVMAEAKDLGIEDRVEFLGRRNLEQLVDAILDCDLGVIPNQRNPFTDINTPTRIFEYTACGKPVLAPRTMGIQDYFDEDDLLYFESGDVDSLARQIEYAVTHPRELVDIGIRSQEVYRRHRWSEERGKLVNLVGSMLDLKASPKSGELAAKADAN